MRSNFTIQQKVGLEGEFGYLDVHNCYNLVGIVTAFDKRWVRLDFVVNEHALEGSPATFALELSEMSVFEGRFDEGAADPLDIDEVTFRAPDDRDLDVSGGGLTQKSNEGDQLVLRFFNGHLRIGATTAHVMVRFPPLADTQTERLLSTIPVVQADMRRIARID
jgi:hypothetical protein